MKNPYSQGAIARGKCDSPLYSVSDQQLGEVANA